MGTTVVEIARQPEDEVRKDLEAAIFSNPRVWALASNPLILTILVLLSGARGGSLPRRRVDLYEKIVDVFLDTWEKSKRATEKFDEIHSINLDSREFRWLLSDVSLAMQKANLTLAPRWWLSSQMREYLQHSLGFRSEEANDTCERIIRYLAERTGLIEERGPDLFGFSHRTLQEYFASLGIIDEADASRARDVTRCLRGYFYNPQWCEVVRLVAAQLTPPLAEQLLRAILDDPDPVGRFLRRGPLLALQCLSDGTTIADQHLTASIFDSLAELGRSKWLGITLNAFDVLEALAGTRFERQAKETTAAILSTAKRELDRSDFECLEDRVLLQELLGVADEKLHPGLESEAAREVSVERADRIHKFGVVNCELLLNQPDIWYQSACAIVRDEHHPEELKEVLLREFSRRVNTDKRARNHLRDILRDRELSSSLREASARALTPTTKVRHNTTQLLVQFLEHDDEDEEVRATCASCLKEAAAEDASIRDKLVESFQKEGLPPKVRAGIRGDCAGLPRRTLTLLICYSHQFPKKTRRR